VASASLGDAGGYRVDVSNTFGSQTSRTATVTVEQVVLRPANDNFAQAEALPGSSGRVTDIGVNLATGENGEPNHAGASEPLTSVWWRWTAPASGQLNLNTFGSDFDTTLAVYTGDSLATLSEITANDDTDGLQSSVSLAATAGQTYSIAVDGYDDNAGSAVLNYALTTGAAPTDNDLFADRQDIPFGTLSVTGSNIGAGGESGEPSHAGASNPLASVWWSWQPAQNVEVSIDTANSDYDTTLAVYLGDRVDALSLVASNDDAIGLQSQVSFQAQGGLSYAIAVDGYGTSEGNIALNLDHAAGDCETGPVLITDMLFTDLNLIRSETRIETDGSVELSAGADVTFESGGDIVLGNGFTVQPGAVFAARLGDVVCAQALGGKGGAETEATQKRRGTPEPQVVGPAVPLPAGLKALSASGALWYLNADAGGRQFVFVTEQRLNDRDRNGVADVYLYDTATDIHRPLSVTAWGETGNGPSDQPRIDRLGRFVVFRSLADNLDDSGDGNDGADVFLTELAGHGLQRIADGTFGLRSRPASHPDVGGDGPFVVFLRTGADGRHELHGHDPRWHESWPLGLPSECDANAPGISADGRYIAVKCDEDETRSVFHVIDRVSGRRGSTICPETLREQSLWPRFREGNRLIEWHPAGKAPYTGAVYTIQNPLAAPGPAP